MVGSGQIFFWGLGLVTISALFSGSDRVWVKLIISIGSFLGMALVAISATPLPLWIYLWLFTSFVLWIWQGMRSTRSSWVIAVLVMAIFTAMVTELPHHIVPEIPVHSVDSILIIGDSVTAGTGSGDQTIKWPAQIEKQHALLVDNLAVPGAKVSAAIKLLKEHSGDSDIAILEIGGNDLLGTTSDNKFEESLDELLRLACKRSQLVIMFELPSLPLRNNVGAIQRRLANEHSVMLIPKRAFMSVLTEPDSTIDSVHLTQAGHDRMAQLVYEILKPAIDIN